MNFDTIIIGGGLSGLTAGIELQKNRKRCVIISSGQSALHFSSGSFDLLNRLPGGMTLDNPMEGISHLIDENPAHPYARIGKSRICGLAERGKELLNEAGISTHGTAGKNHYRITPMGILKKTWLTGSEFVSYDDCRSEWKNIAVLNFLHFADFYHLFIVNELEKNGVKGDFVNLDFPFFKSLRNSPSELRAANIARVFERPEYKEALAEKIRHLHDKYEAILLPACIGLNPLCSVQQLSEMTGRVIKLVATFPPSVSGIYYQQSLRRYFESLGGIYMLGDKVDKGVMRDGRISEIYTVNHGDIPLTGDNILLATGSFFSRGLVATPHEVRENVFGLDVDYLADRKEWYSPDFGSEHNYQSFGVRTNESFQGMIGGEVIPNLYVSGANLGGFNPLKEGSGAGVSILGSLHIADQLKGA